MQNLPQAVLHSQIKKQKRPALPYSALDAKCPRCGSYCGKPCRSSKQNVLKYPHRQRLELAAERFRAEARRQILERLRRHPWGAFSPRRMAVEGFNRKVSAFEGPLFRSGERVRPELACE